MKLDKRLETFWITFPKNPHLPLGIGVTAFSEEDAFEIIRERGIDKWFSSADEVKVESGVRIGDLDPRNIRPNCGPLQFCGVWYPAANVGFGAPGDPEYTTFEADDT